MPKYDPTARPKTKADKEKERREKEQAQVIKPSQRDPRRVTDPLAYGNRYDPVRDAQPVPDLNKKKPSVVDTLLSGIKGAASRAEKDHYSGYNVDDVTNANYNKGKKQESSGKKPERYTPSYMTSSGWTDEVKSYTPEKPEKPKKPTKSQQWAEDLSADAQRAEQREARKAETPKTVSPVDALVPKPSQANSQDQTRLTDTATGNRSEWFPEMSSPEEKPVVPPAPSGYAGFMDDEDDGVDEVPGETFPGTDIPMEKSAREKRMEEKARLEDEKRKLQGEYDDYYQSIMWGTWGVDYGDAELAHLKELEGKIKEYNDQLKEYEGNVDWEGRDALIEEYRDLYNKKNSRSAGLSPEEQARMQEVLGLLQAGDEAAGNEEQYYGGFGERVSGWLQGTLGGVGSNLANTAGTAIDAMAQNYARSYSTDEYLADQLMGSDYFRERSGEEAAAAVHEVMTPVYDYADALGEKATEELEKAKGGLSEFGKAGVDIATNVVQMGCDAGLGYISGAGSLPVMFARTFGGSAQEARQAGADIDQQVLYGLIKGGIEVGTEKLFGGDAGIYGIGSFDNAVEKTLRHLTESDTAMSALRMLAGANQEGLEEVISDLLSPFAERVYNDQAIRDLIANGYPIDQLIYDYILGASVGFLGEVGSVAKGDYAAQNAENHAANEAEARVASLMDGVMDALTGSKQNAAQPAEGLTAAAAPKAEEGRKTSGEERAEEQAPEAPQKEAPVEEAPAEEEAPAKEQPTPKKLGDKQQERKPETPAEILADEASKKGKATEAPSEAAESKIGEDHESVPPSTQESPSEPQEELNNGSRSEEDAQQRKQERIAAANEQTRTEAESLRTEFEQDPVNVQRFQDGQGTYSQYDTQTRLSVLQYLFPEEDYYLSAGNIVKGRQTTASGDFNSTTGQSTTFGDRRTGSDFRRPRATSPTSNIPGPMPSQNSFDPQTVKPGDKLTHNVWGDVTVVGVENGRVQVELADGEVKTVLRDRMGDKFTPVQNAPTNGTIGANQENGGIQSGTEPEEAKPGPATAPQRSGEGNRRDTGKYDLGEGVSDPGANKSWADSLTAQEVPAENEGGERPDDDITPLNEQSRERDEERREKQKAETKKKLGKDNYDRMNKALEKLDAWDKEYTERYGETAKDENGRDIVDDDLNETKTSAVHELATRVRSMLEGEESVQSFAEYYESLRPAEGETNQTDANYLYDGALAEMLNQLADAERALNLSDKGSPADGDVAREEFAKASEAFAGSLETRLGRLEEQFKNRTKANEEITSHAKGEKTGLKNFLDRLKKRFWETQMRVDTFFKMLGGFSEKSEVMNDFAQRGADSTIKRNNVRNSGYEFFHDLSTNLETAKAWKDIESGKTKGNVDIPGLGKASMNYELAMLKTLMTNGALDHIARFGAQFVNEADYYKGYNNNGRGETESYQAQHRLTREMLDQMAKENLQAANELAERTGGKGKKINGKAIYDEKIRILKELRSELMKDVSSNEVALAGYNASIEAMKYLANEINDVTLRLYGVAKALQGSNYWPMQVIGRGNNLQFLNNNAFTMEEASYLQHRKGGSGALQINPFAEVMSSYIERASKFVGFGELNSDLMMMSKEIGVGHGKYDSEKQSLQSVIQKQAGSSAAKWMTRYMETLNDTAKQPSKLGSMLRSNLASSSLSLNPGVALKQSPSYFNAAGIVDLDILIKNRLVTLGALRSAKSYDSNPLIQEINKRTGILESRKSGTVVLGEQDGRAMFGKLKKLLPNWITSRDVSTVSNLALACAEQVKRNNPGIDTKSDSFYEQTAKLLEQAVVKSQPVYDAEFRPDYLRSDNEIVRMLSMFRTQQSQNLNQLMQAYGELEAARREGGDVKAAEKKRNQVVAGYAMSQVAFAILSTAARALTHKTKDYEDEEGNIDLSKAAKRVGLDFLTTAGGVVWFGDTLSKVAIDAATGLYAKATGKKDAATSEFFSMSDNTISVIDDVIGSTIKVFQNPTPKTIKNEVFDLAQSVGLPARNFYNILNSAFMYGTDALHKNPGNYDDAIDMWQTESKKSDTTRAKDTTEAAVKAFTKGDTERGNTLLATLDYSNKDVASAVKKAAGDAYVRGDIDEKTYRKILRDTAGAAAEAEVKAAEAALKAKEIDGKTYAEIVKNAGKTDDDAINKVVHSKDIDRTIAALTERDPKKYEALIENIDDAKENALTGTSKSNAVARLILDAAMSKEGQAAFMEKYTSSDYFKAYEAASVGYKAEKVIEALANIDENKDDQFTQEELYAYFRDTGHSEIVRAVWRANGWTTSFDEYRKQKAKTAEYDKVAGENESYEFGEAEKKLKELKSGNTMHIQTGGGDPEMFRIISGMGLSVKDTDTVVDKYVSSKTKTNYHVLRDNGYDPAKAMELLTVADTDGKGTLSQKEMYAYYKAHKSDEAVIEALWNAQGYKKDWKTYKKKQK